MFRCIYFTACINSSLFCCILFCFSFYSRICIPIYLLMDICVVFQFKVITDKAVLIFMYKYLYEYMIWFSLVNTLERKLLDFQKTLKLCLRCFYHFTFPLPLVYMFFAEEPIQVFLCSGYKFFIRA